MTLKEAIKLKKAFKKLSRLQKEGLKDLTPLQIEVLKYVRDNQPCTQGDIIKHFSGDKRKEQKCQDIK